MTIDALKEFTRFYEMQPFRFGDYEQAALKLESNGFARRDRQGRYVIAEDHKLTARGEVLRKLFEDGYGVLTEKRRTYRRCVYAARVLFLAGAVLALPYFFLGLVIGPTFTNLPATVFIALILFVAGGSLAGGPINSTNGRRTGTREPSRGRFQ